jgi:ribulose-5-phosphate 4-epimerase/fuculose-1-phosphate aldolase
MAEAVLDDLEELRARVAMACRILAESGVSEGTLGHVSARLDASHLLVRCRRPEERGLLFTRPADVQLVDLDGRLAERPAEEPAGRVPNELPIHTEIYRARPDVRAVVHAHPPAALIAGLAGLELRPVFGAYNIPALHMARAGVPVYPRPVLITRADLGAELVRAMEGSPVCLMRGHGITACGDSVQQATVRAINCNVLAEVARELAWLGARPPEVSAEDLAELPDLGSAFNDEMVWRHHVAMVERAESGTLG